MEKRPRRMFTDEFKKQMVDLYNAGKPRIEIAREYDLTLSALCKAFRINRSSIYYICTLIDIFNRKIVGGVSV